MKNRWFVIVPGFEKDAPAMGTEVKADMVAIEPSGAVTFWDHVIAGQKQTLVAAYSQMSWTSVRPLPEEDETPEEFKEAAQR